MVYVADADMNDRMIEILKSTGKPIRQIKGDEQKPTVIIHHTTTKIAQSELLKYVGAGKTGVFQCDSIRTANIAYEDAKATAPAEYKILLVHGKNKDEFEQAAYLRSPNEIGKQYDLIILTPVVSSGFSIELEYDFHVGVFSGQLSPTEIIQTLGRNRKAKDIILGLSPKRKQKSLSVAEQLTGIVSAEGRITSIGGQLIHVPNEFDKVAAGVMEEYESSCERFAHTTLLILMQKGYQVEELKEPESLIIIKGTAKAVKDKHVQDVIQADSISAIEYGNLKKSSKVTEDEHNAIEKFECREQLALGEEVSEKDIQLWNDGKLAPALKNSEIVNGEQDNAQSLDKHESAMKIAPKDRTYATSKMIIFHTVMSLLQGKSLHPPYLLKKGTDKLSITHNNVYLSPSPENTGISLQRYDAERIKAAIDYLQDNYQEVHAAGLGNFKDVNRKLDTRTLGQFLKRFGLKHKRVGKNLAGNYQITEDSLIQMQDINKRRKAKKISVYNQSQAWSKSIDGIKMAA
ncbi:putative DNA primase/helicase [Bathymodiolus japonicus methanotrophic gill symbiont]|uniref:hypothetical protein n=1 Tax=Bathymodiolus japonicus methanotrophic gill symbiont TaxID=113269 RepID=UPI001B4C0883|nr:hypothetical protein [Bathymodiolus japonicus methanotrophic gill symbiont]GFO73467.1 putative DNA primase/helicase [Bathymodiolus japonicus methanotrophic gill symbiont]